jgi:SOS-response transcriptional repressor LexA
VGSVLTEKQAAVLAFLRRRADRGDPPPTNREICDEFGWSSTRSARDHLSALARKGRVQLPSGRGHRRVRVLGGATPPSLGRFRVLRSGHVSLEGRVTYLREGTIVERVGYSARQWAVIQEQLGLKET